MFLYIVLWKCVKGVSGGILWELSIMYLSAFQLSKKVFWSCPDKLEFFGAFPSSKKNFGDVLLTLIRPGSSKKNLEI